MIRSRFKPAKEVTTCDSCGELVVIPPGVYYRDLRLHKGCARSISKRDFGDEVLDPHLDNIQQEIEDLFQNMTGNPGGHP